MNDNEGREQKSHQQMQCPDKAETQIGQS